MKSSDTRLIQLIAF